MLTNIRAWGNSQGLYIPRKLLKEASLNVNDPVDISVVDGVLMIRKDMSGDNKRNAMEALRNIRNAHKGHAENISRDYRTERNEHIDEKYFR